MSRSQENPWKGFCSAQPSHMLTRMVTNESSAGLRGGGEGSVRGPGEPMLPHCLDSWTLAPQALRPVHSPQQNSWIWNHWSSPVEASSFQDKLHFFTFSEIGRKWFRPRGPPMKSICAWEAQKCPCRCWQHYQNHRAQNQTQRTLERKLCSPSCMGGEGSWMWSVAKSREVLPKEQVVKST